MNFEFLSFWFAPTVGVEPTHLIILVTTKGRGITSLQLWVIARREMLIRVKVTRTRKAGCRQFIVGKRAWFKPEDRETFKGLARCVSNPYGVIGPFGRCGFYKPRAGFCHPHLEGFPLAGERFFGCGTAFHIETPTIGCFGGERLAAKGQGQEKSCE